MLRRFLVAMGVVIASFAIAAPAFAHVTVHPDSLPKGSSDVELTFRVPNEEEGSTTKQVDLQVPTDHPLLSAQVKPIAGWKSEVKTTHLATPVKTDDGDVSDVISEITWTANAGSEIQSGQYQDFDIAVGTLPSDTTSIAFKTLQTYSNGDVVRWIEDTPASGAAPEHPSPVLTLTKEAVSTTASTKAKDNTARTLAIVGIALGAIAFVAAAALRKRS